MSGLQDLVNKQGIFSDWGSNFERIQQILRGGGQESQKAPPKSSEPAPTTSKARPTTKPQGRDAPMMDQHEFDHWRADVFCGLATTAMMLQANGLEGGTSRAELDAYAKEMYIPGNGTAGSEMARYLRGAGLEDSQFVTNGSRSRLVKSLQTGQPVPLGVMMSQGEVTRLKGGSSERYPHLRVGDRHHKRFRGGGHWVLVTRFEGKPDKPTAFYVNDPDVGGQLKVTPAELTKMAVAEGNYWMVEQQQ